MGLSSVRGIATIVTGDQVARALAMLESIQRTNDQQSLKFHVLVVDRDENVFSGRFPNCATWTLKGISRAWASINPMAFLYPLPQLRSALKPFFMHFLLNEGHATDLIYVDPDLRVYTSLETIYDLLKAHSAVLTPWILTPSRNRGSPPSDREILVSGTFATDFFAVGRDFGGLELLSWWARHVEAEFFQALDVQDGSLVPQTVLPQERWLNLVPALFPKVHVLRMPAYGLGAWNLHERPLAWRKGRFWVGEDPLVSFHFRGLEVVTRRGSAIRRLYSDYFESIRRAGDPIFSGLRSPLEEWDNGFKIPWLARRMLPRARSEDFFFDPRNTGSPRSYFSWLMVGSRERAPRLLVEIWNLRADVRAFFPDPNGQDRDRFLQWAIDFGIHEMDLDPQLAEVFAQQRDFSRSQVSV